MTTPSRPPIERVDISLLHIFCTVVDAGGFTSAQTELDISGSALSTKMSTLESRLGMRLCQRGRMGFRLTTEGKRVYAAAKELFAAYRGFEAEIGSLHGQIVGELNLALMDNTITNPRARIHQAIARFMRRRNSVEFRMEVLEPARIERGLLDGTFHIGIAAFYHHVAGLHYERLFTEEQILYCGKAHPLFAVPSARLALKDITQADYVARGYMGPRAAAPKVAMNARASAFDMESIARLVLSGYFIGYLPSHYAQYWVEIGELRPLLPHKLNYDSVFEVATRKGAPQARSVKFFLEDLRAEVLDATPAERGARGERWSAVV